MTRANYDSHREGMAAYQSAKRQAAADIPSLPPVVDQGRRDSCERDLRLFCETYRPAAFYLGWCDDHLRVLERIETTAIDGGLFGLAMPRGSGKTTLAITAVTWALLYGHRRWVCLIGATQPKAVSLLKSIKTELRFNDLLAQDFPEVCTPIRKIEGKAARCGSQTYKGVPTSIEWTMDRLTLPTVEGSPASGSRVSVAGITGDIRGQQDTMADGRVMRPDYVIPDDPQTRESARSPQQTMDRLATLNGDILGLSGPDVSIAGVMPCTVISAGDLADQILDRDANPEWHGEKTQLLYGFPTNLDLWDQYQTILHNDMRNGGDGEAATEFYLEHKEAMDKGALAAWDDRHSDTEASGIQHAMNLFFRDEAAFWAEYQNEPKDTEDDDLLSAKDIAERTNELKRRVLPSDAETITGMIDVQKDMLFYVVIAWRKDFTGCIVDYGAFPDQDTTNFRYKQARKTLSRLYPKSTLEVKLQRALTELVKGLCGHMWARDDGVELSVDRLFIDANWGESRDIVYNFIRTSPYRGALLPSHGKFVGAGTEPLNARHIKKSKGSVGLNWRIAKSRDMPLRHVLYDTNYWKSFFHTRLATEPHTGGSLTLWKASPHTHKTFASHCRAENPVKTEGRGRQVTEWKWRPDRPDNHWLDCAVGACVAASIEGCVLPGMRAKKKAKADMGTSQGQAHDTPAPKGQKKKKRGVSYL